MTTHGAWISDDSGYPDCYIHPSGARVWREANPRYGWAWSRGSLAADGNAPSCEQAMSAALREGATHE